MKSLNLLSQNLKQYQAFLQKSTGEFAKELDLPETTLRSILKEGNTTLDTAIRISQNLGISLDMLVHDSKFSDKLLILSNMQKVSSWLADFPQEKREHIAKLMSEIWKIIEG